MGSMGSRSFLDLIIGLDCRTGRVKLRSMSTRRPGMDLLVLLVTLTAERGIAADAGLKPWATNIHPTDAARSHVEEITTGQHTYNVTQAGTMDGRNCRSPMGCGIAREGALLQQWESNRSVRMDNVGETDLVNPWRST